MDRGESSGAVSPHSIRSQYPSRPLRAGDRVAVRDRPWRVEAASVLGDGKTLLKLLPAVGDGDSPLAVVTPPERVVALPPEELRFDPAEIGPIMPWLRAHQALAITAIQDGALRGARFGRVTLEAYQIAPVLRILAKPKPRLLIADDVGLGKTIEAGLCLLELMSRRLADRVLVVVPPGLIAQWQEEMLERFGLNFVVIENAAGLAREQTELPAGVSPWDLPQARIITSMDYLKKDEVRRRALAQPWDVVIVDEAHALAESGSPQNPYRTRRTRLGEDLRDHSRGLLLLTATPHNGYAHSFRSLIELVEPTAAALTGPQTRERIERAMIRRMKRQIGRLGQAGTWIPAFPKRTVTPIPVKVSAQEADLFRLISAYCSRTATEARGEEDEELISFAMQIIKKRAISSRLALARTLDHRLRALKREEEREEKPDRSELRDYQAALPLSDQQAERVSRRILRSAIPKDERRRKAEVRKITEIQRLLAKLPPADPKVTALIGHLRAVLTADPSAKIIVFTEYLDTLEAIKTALGEAGPPLAGAHVELRGGLTMRQRQQRQQRFEEPDVRVLLATDAASEGLNLQRACHRLVHFELPWNPNRLEQRNGRIDRYGQAHPPDIRYLYYPDSPEDDVLARLVKKIEEMAEARVSTPDVLGVALGLGLERRLVQVDPEDAAAADRLLRDFEDRTGEFAGEVQPLLLPSGDARDEIRRGERALTQAVPLVGDDPELERFLLDALGPNAVTPTDEEGVFRIEVPRVFMGPDVARRYERATCRRSVAARTRPAEVEYLTPLHPLVQAIAAEARRRFIQVYPDDRGLPSRRLAARRIPAGEPPGILFTFYGTIRGREGVIEETILPVRVNVGGSVQGAPDTDGQWLYDRSRPGEVPPDLLAPHREQFDELLRAAGTEAACRLAARAEEIRNHRCQLGQRLRADAEAYRADRLKELQEEEIRTRGLIKDTGQVLLRIAEEPARYNIDAKRAAVEAHLKTRLDEIEAFAQVDEPEFLHPIGGLLLVPEGTDYA